MDTKVNYATVGLFVIILGAMLIAGFVWLSGFSHHKIYQTYLVYARGGVTGLNVDSPVLFNGVRVGSVGNIEIDKSNPQLVKLYLKVESKMPVTESTVATLIPQGITGLVYVGLEAESSQAPLLKVEEGQPYPIIPYRKPLLMQITEVLPELTKNLEEISGSFKKLLSDQNLMNISRTLDHLDNFTGALDKQSDTIKSSMSSLNVLLRNTAVASQHFEGTMVAAQKTAEQLNKTSSRVDLEINNLSQQTMPSIQELITRLNDTTANLQQITQEVEGNPAILVRGKQPSPPGPGE